MTHDDHYLKQELYKLVESDKSIFEFLQAGALDGVWYWDLQNPEHEWLSENFWTVLGYDPRTKKHLASEWQELINPEDLQTALENFNAHCADPNHPYDQIVRYRHKNGTTVWVRCRGIVIRDANGKPIRMLGAHTNITALKEAELALTRKNEELRKAQARVKEALREAEDAQRKAEEANQSKSRFLSHMSHELRSPLNSVIGFADIIQSEIYGPHVDDRYRNYAKHISSSGNHLLHLIGDVLDFSKIESGVLELESIGFDLLVLVEDIRSFMQTRIEDKGLSFRIDIPSIGESRFMGDPTRIRQVLINLVDNALKFTSKGSIRISIETMTTKGDESILKFSVYDTGIGIHQDKLAFLFDPFSQAEKSTSRHFGGSGLGLSICKQLAEAMGGKIGAESKEGEGSCFWFELPLTLEAEPQYEKVTMDSVAPRALTILLVDDIDMNLLLAQDQPGSIRVCCHVPCCPIFITKIKTTGSGTQQNTTVTFRWKFQRKVTAHVLKHDETARNCNSRTNKRTFIHLFTSSILRQSFNSSARQ